MPKLLAMRWPVGLGLSLLLIAAIGAALPAVGASWMTGRLAAAFGLVQRDEFTGERDELLFFGAALGRIEAELRRKGTPAPLSLRREHEAVLQRIRDVAIRVPRDRLPLDIARLVVTSAGSGPVAAAIGRAAPTNRPRVLLTGLGPLRPANDLPGLALDALVPLPVFVERVFVERARPLAAIQARPSATAEERSSATPPKAEGSRAARAERKRAERAERTQAEKARVSRKQAEPAVADQSERRQTVQ